MICSLVVSFLGEFDDVGDELVADPSDEAKVDHHPARAVSASAVTHGEDYVVQCCTQTDSQEQNSYSSHADSSGMSLYLRPVGASSSVSMRNIECSSNT